LRQKVWQHIRDNAKEKQIALDVINGHVDHCHCIVSLGVNSSASRIMQLLKGESAHWINSQHLCKEKFEWQDEYFGVAVCDSTLDLVRKYILDQEEHHKHKTFQEEYDQLMKRYGFQ
jgi:putative transposase